MTAEIISHPILIPKRIAMCVLALAFLSSMLSPVLLGQAPNATAEDEADETGTEETSATTSETEEAKTNDASDLEAAADELQEAGKEPDPESVETFVRRIKEYEKLLNTIQKDVKKWKKEISTYKKRLNVEQAPFDTNLTELQKAIESYLEAKENETKSDMFKRLEKLKATSKPEKQQKMFAEAVSQGSELMTQIIQWEDAWKLEASTGTLRREFVKADHFAVERKLRHRLEDYVLSLWRIIYILMEQKLTATADTRKFLLTIQDGLELQQDEIQTLISILRARGDAESLLTSFEYYEVPKPMTIKEVCAEPDVYGNPSLWQKVMVVNEEVIKDKDKPIEAGTVLMIPKVPQQREFKFE